MDPFGNDDLKDDIIPKDKNSKSLFIKKIIIFLIALIIWVLIVIIELSVVLNSEENEQTDNKEQKDVSNMTEIGEIICYHEVVNDPEELQLISEKFDKNLKLEIYVNGTKVNDSIKYKIDQKGIYQVKIILFEPNINYIFKDIQSLTSVDLDSKNKS